MNTPLYKKVLMLIALLAFTVVVCTGARPNDGIIIRPEPVISAHGDRPVTPIPVADALTPAQQSPSTAGPEAPEVPAATRDFIAAKKAFLTFDDGPNSHFTGQILDILKHYGVKATFVVVGVNVEINPGVLQRIIDEGHAVVNHTYSHDYKKIYASPAAFLEDLEKGARVIERFTSHNSMIFRAPGGPANLKPGFRSLLAEHGYQSLGWNVSGADSDPAGVEPGQIFENVKNGVIAVEKRGKEPVILLHDGTEINPAAVRPGTPTYYYVQNRASVVAALPDIIEFLQEKGYYLAAISEELPEL